MTHISIDSCLHIPVVRNFASLAAIRGLASAALVVSVDTGHPTMSKRPLTKHLQREEAALVVWAESEHSVFDTFCELDHKIQSFLQQHWPSEFHGSETVPWDPYGYLAHDVPGHTIALDSHDLLQEQLVSAPGLASQFTDSLEPPSDILDAWLAAGQMVRPSLTYWLRELRSPCPR